MADQRQEMTVRKAAPPDLLSLWSTDAAGDITEELRKATEDGQAVVAMLGEVPVAFGCARRRDTTLDVYRLHVHPAYEAHVLAELVLRSLVARVDAPIPERVLCCSCSASSKWIDVLEDVGFVPEGPAGGDVHSINFTEERFQLFVVLAPVPAVLSVMHRLEDLQRILAVEPDAPAEGEEEEEGGVEEARRRVRCHTRFTGTISIPSMGDAESPYSLAVLQEEEDGSMLCIHSACGDEQAVHLVFAKSTDDGGVCAEWHDRETFLRGRVTLLPGGGMKIVGDVSQLDGEEGFFHPQDEVMHVFELRLDVREEQRAAREEEHAALHDMWLLLKRIMTGGLASLREDEESEEDRERALAQEGTLRADLPSRQVFRSAMHNAESVAAQLRRHAKACSVITYATPEDKAARLARSLVDLTRAQAHVLVDAALQRGQLTGAAILKFKPNDDVIYGLMALRARLHMAYSSFDSALRLAEGRVPTSDIRACMRVLDATVEDLCTICQCPCEGGEEVVSLRCRHTFHSDCGARWLHDHSSCPVCRASVVE